MIPKEHPDYIALGTTLKALRGKRKAREVVRKQERDERLTQSYISRIENGAKRPGLNRLLALLDGMEVKPADAPPLVRAALLRLALDERQVGVAAALRNLSDLERGERPAIEAPPAELDLSNGDALPTREQAPRKQNPPEGDRDEAAE